MSIGKTKIFTEYIPVKDPILNARPRVLGLVLSLVPILLNLSDKALGVICGSVLGLDTLLLQVCAELSGVPVTIWLGNLGLPVVLDSGLKLGTIIRSWVWDIVIR